MATKKATIKITKRVAKPKAPIIRIKEPKAPKLKDPKAQVEVNNWTLQRDFHINLEGEPQDRVCFAIGMRKNPCTWGCAPDPCSCDEGYEYPPKSNWGDYESPTRASDVRDLAKVLEDIENELPGIPGTKKLTIDFVNFPCLNYSAKTNPSLEMISNINRENEKLEARYKKQMAEYNSPESVKARTTPNPAEQKRAQQKLKEIERLQKEIDKLTKKVA